MPTASVIGLIVVAIVANLVLMVVILAPSLGRRRRAVEVEGLGEPFRDAAVREAEAAEGDVRDAILDDVPPWAYDRIVRIVSWVFILAAAVIVSTTPTGDLNEPAIFVLLAVVAVFVLVMHDLMPSAILGSAKFLVEGSVAITFVTLLVAMTGRESSPFFFAYPLIVAGAALVVSPTITAGLTGAASVGYLLAIFARDVAVDPLNPNAPAAVAANLTALILLAYVATFIAREQRRARDAAIHLSTVDPLSGLFNRTYFFAAIEREIQRSARSGRGFCLLMMDLDELKAINDRYGHFHGDRVLQAVGAVIRAGVRRIDTAARYGGDEFVVLLPETDPTGGRVLGEKIRQGVTELRFPDGMAGMKASLSVGVVSYPNDGLTADALMITADSAMYSSKRRGKNRVTAPEDGLVTDERDPDDEVETEADPGAAV